MVVGQIAWGVGHIYIIAALAMGLVPCLITRLCTYLGTLWHAIPGLIHVPWFAVLSPAESIVAS